MSQQCGVKIKCPNNMGVKSIECPNKVGWTLSIVPSSWGEIYNVPTMWGKIYKMSQHLGENRSYIMLLGHVLENSNFSYCDKNVRNKKVGTFLRKINCFPSKKLSFFARIWKDVYVWLKVRPSNIITLLPTSPLAYLMKALENMVEILESCWKASTSRLLISAENFANL